MTHLRLLILLLVIHLHEIDAHGQAALSESIGTSPLTLAPPNNTAVPLFGTGVAFESERVIVGAPSKSSEAGSVYIFRKAGSQWTVEGTLSGTGDPGFGAAVAISGDIVAVINLSGRAVSLYDVKGPQFRLLSSLDLPQPVKPALLIKNQTILLQSLRDSLVQVAIRGSQLQMIQSEEMVAPELGDSRIAISGHTVLIGLPSINERSGTARLFELTSNPTEILLTPASVDHLLAQSCGEDYQREDTELCTVSTLHSLWEERRILYTDYDRILKKMWSSSNKVGTAPAEHASTLAQKEKLLDTYLEQQRLERRITVLYNKLLASHVKSEFARVEAALRGVSPVTQLFDPQEMKLEISRLYQILENLNRNNPELPQTSLGSLDLKTLDQIIPPQAKPTASSAGNTVDHDRPENEPYLVDLSEQNRRLFRGAFLGDTSVVTEALAEGASINAQDSRGWTPLFAALKVKQSAMAILLMEKGADAKIVSVRGTSPLSVAAENGDLELSTLILAQGVDLNVVGKDGQSALYSASLTGNPAVVELLLRRGAKVDQPAVGEATPLIAAADHGNSAVLNLLIQAKANLNLQNRRGRTALMQAAIMNHVDCVRILLEHGASHSIKDAEGISAIELAANSARLEAIKLLISHGATQDRARAFAMERNSIEILNYLDQLDSTSP